MTRRLKKLLMAILRFGLLVFCSISLLFWLAQELFIFPLLWNKILGTGRIPTPPAGTSSFMVKTSDGETLEVWTSLQDGEKPEYVAIVFHGNGETVASRNFLPFFRNIGVPAFTFDYRGYGNSSGWPSEAGLYHDADAVWESVHSKTGLGPDRIIILGNSIGSGPATYLAQKIGAHGLILLSAYSNFSTLVSEKSFYSLFRFLLRYDLPTSDFIARIRNGCMILTHGEGDTLIPFAHLLNLQKKVDLSVKLTVLTSKEAGHNDLFYKIEDELYKAAKDCLVSGMPAP